MTRIGHRDARLIRFFSSALVLSLFAFVACTTSEVNDNDGTAPDDTSTAATAEPTEPVEETNGISVADAQQPEQEPGDAAVQILAAIENEDWDQLRSLSIEPVSGMQRDESIMFIVQHLRVPARDVVPSLDQPDDWQVATYEDRAVVYHSEIAAFRLAFVPGTDGWLYDPGPYHLAHAKVIEITGDPRDATSAINPERGTPLVDVRDVDDSDLASALSLVLDSGRASIEFDGDVPVIGMPLTLLESASATIDVGDITWRVGEESGAVSKFWTDAIPEDDGRRVVMPGNPNGEVDAHFGFRLEDAPVDGDTVRIKFGTVRVTGIELGSVDVELNVDDVDMSASYEWAFEPAPDLQEIKDSEGR